MKTNFTLLADPRRTLWLLWIFFSFSLTAISQTAPTVQSPSHGASNLHPMVSIWFNQMNNVNKVEYELDTDQAFGNAEGQKISGQVSQTSFGNGVANNVSCYYFYVSGLAFGETYYLRIRALDGAGVATNWSTSRSISTLPSLTIQSPSSNAAGVHPLTSIWFNQVSGVNKVEYEFDTDQNFGNAEGNRMTGTVTSANFGSGTANNTSCYYVSLSGLKFGKTYYYRVRGYNTNNVTSDWSTLRSLTTLSTLTIQSPSVNAVGVTPQTSIWFNQVSGLNKIEYEFDTDQNFGNAEGNRMTGTVTSANFGSGTANNSSCYYVSLSGLKFGKTYYYRIRGYNANDVSSDWSASRSLTTVSTLTVQSPSASAVGVNPQTSIWFNQIFGLSKVEYEFDTDQNFGNAEGNRMTGTVTSANFGTGTANNTSCYYVSLSALKFGKTYYYRIRGYNSNDVSSDWSSSRSLTTVATLTVQSPSVNAVGIHPQTSIWFNQISGLSKIEYEFDTDVNFGNAQGDRMTGIVTAGNFGSGTANNTSCYYVNLTGLKFGKTYYYRIRGFNSNDVASDWSASRSLTTVGALTIQSPSLDAMGINPQTSIWFNQLSGLSKIEYEFDTDQNFGNAGGNKTTGVVTSGNFGTGTANNVSCYYVNVLGLKFGKNYYYRLRAFNTAENESAWSSVRSLKSVVRPVLNSPAINATNVSTSSPTLSWTDLSGESGYQVELSTSNLFASTLFSITQTGTSISAGTLSSNTTYFWRVRAKVTIGSADYWSDWTERRFTTGATLVTLPGAPSLSSPENNATEQSVDPLLKWTLVDGASYKLEYSTDVNFIDGVTRADLEEDITEFQLNDLDNNLKIYWRVRSVLGTLASPWSSEFSFVTETIKTPVTVNFSNNSYTYDGIAKAITVTTNPANVSHSVQYKLGDVIVSNPTHAGTYEVTVSVTDNLYVLNGAATAQLTIAKAALTVAADDKSKTYGATNPTLTLTYTGMVNGEDASVIDTPPQIQTTATQFSNTGSYAIELSGGTDNDYAFTLQNGSLTIAKAPLTISADEKSKTYGQANPTLTYSLNGLLGNDEQGVIDVLPEISTTASTNSNAGEYQITLSGGSDNNYELTLENGTMAIAKAVLTVTVDAKTRVYGSPNPVLTFGYSGFVNNEAKNVLDAEPEISTAATNVSSVGSYPITVSGGSDNNYAYDLVNNFLSITKADLIVSAENKTRSFGQVNPLLTFVYTGFVGNDDANDIDTEPVIGTTATMNSEVGEYVISITNGVDNNYALNRVNGILTIVKADQQITFEALPTKFVGEANFAIVATSSSSLPLTFESSMPSVASVAGNMVTLHATGSTEITATQAGNSNFNAASVTRTLVVQSQLGQVITFNSVADKTIGDPAFTITATATSNLPITFEASNDNVLIVNNLVQMLAPGTVTITARQSGNTQFSPAEPVTQTFCVKPTKPFVTIVDDNAVLQTLVSSAAIGNQWYIGDVSIVGATQSTLQTDQAGDYSVDVTMGGCTSDRSEIVSLVVTSLESQYDFKVHLYPNPVRDRVTFDFSEYQKEMVKTIEIATINGKVLHTTLTSSQAHEVDLRDFANGLYVVTIRTGNAIERIKFIKQY